MATLQNTCTHCSQSFDRDRKFAQANLTRGQVRSFCGQSCFHEYQRCTRVQVPCLQCAKATSRVPSLAGGHVFCTKSCAARYNNAHKTTGTRRSKLEVWLEERLRTVYPDLDLHCNRTDAINAELDFYFPSLRLAFELNGIFHYEPIYGPEKLARMQTNDSRKYQACLEQGIELCIIDSSSMIHFKPKGAERYLTLVQEVVDRVIPVRLDEGIKILSEDPLRGRVSPSEPIATQPLPFKAALALETAILWRQDVDQGLTHQAIASREGCSQPHVTRILSLLRLPEPIRTGLLSRDPSYGLLQTKAAMKMVSLGPGEGFEPPISGL